MVDKITDDHVNEIRTIFDLFDCNLKDGNLTKDEMKKFLATLGVFPSKTELHEMFQFFDTSSSGMIDFPDFLSLMTRDIEKKYGTDDIQL